jgi:putative RNA 2'-phosphotransferase
VRKDLVRISKFLSLVLRHKPEELGLELDAAGWVPVNDLLEAAAFHGMKFSREQLDEVVRTNEKKRFAFSADGRMIRANQGHSVEVELGYEPAVPPPILYHGTVERFLPSIRKQGLIKGNRQHVHLSPDVDTAIGVGNRRGKPVVLKVSSGQMQADGFAFYLSANGVWLTDHVPVRYLELS